MKNENYSTLTAKMKQAKTLEEFHIYSVLLVQWLKSNGSK